MYDTDPAFLTCLSPDPHEDNIRDHFLHFLGCVEISERNQFLETAPTTNAVQLQGSLEYDTGIDTQKKAAWREDCLSELRRIAFLRSKLENDEEEKHHVENVNKSRERWKASQEFKLGIDEVKNWRKKPEVPLAEGVVKKNTYDPRQDVNTPFMLFKKRVGTSSVYERDDEEVDPGNAVWGKFPNQKTNVQRLLFDEKKANLLDGRGVDEKIRYFHIPSNNMLMPYMHWETSRNQQRFSQIIENIVDAKKIQDARTQKDARERRQLDRVKLRRPKRPAPTDSRSYWDRIQEHFRDLKAKPASGSGEATTSDTNEDQRKQLHFGPIRSMTDLLKAQAVKENLQLSGSYPQVDHRGRVDIDAWLEEQGTSMSKRKRSWFRPSRKDSEGHEPRYRLGQYLIDAARLFEAMTSYRDRQLLETYLMEDPPMHPRRTLDQAYYWSINNTNHRDLDQVVYRATTADPLKFHRWNVDRSIWTGHSHEENKTPKELEGHKHEPCPECTANIQKVSRVIMVDQLWMWMLDRKTIITCFPKRYGANKHDTSGIHKSIRMRIEQGGVRIRSVFDLALVIFEECSNTFFDRTRTTDKQPQVLDEFSEAIGNIMHQQTAAFERLWRWTERASKMYCRPAGSGVVSQLHIPLLDINPEGKLEKEIKDIVEELGIMTYIKKAEKDVLRSFVDNARQILKPADADEVLRGPQTPSVARLDEYFVSQKGWETRAGTSSPAKGSKSLPRSREIDEARAARAAYEWFCNNALELLKRVDHRIAQLEELERSAKSTADMVKDLLELKQQQAGVVQAWQSVEYSNEATRQGRSILVFTIVTIVFLPLSFMSSVFGMNAIELGGSENVMHLRDQFTYIFSISAGVIVLTLLFSISTTFRTFLWCIFKQSYTTALVWTGIYRNIYLKMNLTTDDMYENAVKKTESLKAKEKEKFLTFRRERKEREEERKHALSSTGEDVPNMNGASWMCWALSFFREKSVRGTANNPEQDNPRGLGANHV
ncbi:hypothetical protein DHEL01_v200987 [Diaporthe helianthi]|uniref:Ankyrin repeat protein n=1 Tax=Diaporthe helianthi TaxID=158607 RepID=A0A2P5IDP2_DIAHE|nr:hypothetical protein DHEL01_v200987 [Diaporthe helianthi]